MVLPPGARVGSFEILALVGAGGMGTVYRAYDTKLRRDVAVKVLSAAPDEDSRALLLREARAASALSHPNVCVVHDVQESEGRVFLVMEYIAGRPLAELIPGGGLPVDAVAGYGLQIADALVHAHDRGVVHRDLKSANVIITPEGRAKVLDFGLARRPDEAGLEALTRSETSLAEAGTIAGTLAYMAPEALRGEPADARADLWALGVLLYEMTTGARPFGGRTVFELCSAVLREPLPPVRSRVSPALRRVIERCLAKDPGQRYQRAGEVRAALEAALAGASVVGRTSRRDRKEGVRARRARPPRIRSLAVLPLENLSSDPEQEYFVDGMTEALIANLARIGALRVISRTSIMQYKEARKPLPQIARELNVDAIVEGSALRAGERIRITAQLIHAASDTHLWADSYERDLSDVLALQSDVARAIAQEIRIKVTPREQARLAAVRRVDPGAYTLYLQGRYYWNRMGEARFRRSIEYFEQAVALDPDYAPAHAGIADFYNVLARFGWARPHDVVPKAKAAARRAVELDESLVEAHAALGYTAIFYDWDWPAAERELKRAIELNPGHAMAHQYYTWYLAIHRRLAESLAEIERACALDPLSILQNAGLGQQYFLARDYGRSVAQLQRTLEMDPNSALVRWSLALVYLQQQRFDDAIGELQKAMALIGGEEFLPWLAYAYALSGRRDEAQKTLDGLVAKSTTGYVPADDIARIYVGLGEADRAFEWLDRACDERAGWVPYLAIDPSMDPIRRDPRFATLLRRVGLEAPAATEAPPPAADALGGARSSVPPARPPRKTVGRQAERAALRAAFEQVASGPGLLVGIAGEPGLGKTTLVEDFLADLGDDGRACAIARGRCSERLAGTEAYLPVLEALDSLTGTGADPHLAPMLRAVAPTWYAQLAPLKPEEPSDARVLADVKAASQERLKREFVAFLSEAGRGRPLVLFLDDLHWADASTVDLLAYLADRFDKVRCLVLATYRPTELTLAKHPFATLKLDLAARGARELALEFLTREDIDRYLALEFPGHRFPPMFQEMVCAKTEGNPLFVVDLLRYLRDRRVIRQDQGQWTVTEPVGAIEREVPASVRSLIQRKLDQVAEEDRPLLLAASVQGYAFDSAVLARALELDAADVEERLDALARIHALVYRVGEHALPDAAVNVRYRFVHVLYQNAWYDSLTPTRRASLSRAVAEALLDSYGERRAEIASTLALLFEAACDFARAVEYFHVAAMHATLVFAYHETVGVASRGLHLLESLPDTPERLRKELDLHLLLGAALTTTQGWGAPEVQRTYARAQELSETVGEPPELFPALFGLAEFYTVRAEYQTVQKIAERLVRTAEEAQDSGLLLLAHWAMAWTWWIRGEFDRSRSHYERCDSLYVPTQHHALTLLYSQDPGVGSLICGALAQWYLGYSDQSLTTAKRSLAHAHHRAHPFSVVYALGYALMLYQLRREPYAIRECLEPFMALVTEHQFAFYAPWGTFFGGWALAEEGEVQKGIAQMQQGLEAHRSVGGEMYRPAFLALLAEACGKAGRVDEGLPVIDQALSLVGARGERQHEAEIHRIKGDLLLQRDPPDHGEAERCFHQALAVANGQQAKLPELRAAVSLGRLWRTQGRPDEARALVGAVYAWFTEGFDTVDLREAKAFLAE